MHSVEVSNAAYRAEPRACSPGRIGDGGPSRPVPSLRNDASEYKVVLRFITVDADCDAGV